MATKENQYPWIPRDYYAAVMFACKMIRETQWFNKSVHTAAKYYHVDEDKLAQYVNERTHAKKRKPTGKMKWYVVTRQTETEASGAWYNGWQVMKGTRAENIRAKLDKADSQEDRRNDYGGNYALITSHFVLGEFENEAKAHEMGRKVDALIKARGWESWPDWDEIERLVAEGGI